MSRMYRFFVEKFIDHIDARQLWRRYFVGLGVIVLLLCASHLASSWALRSAENDAQVINESGRQRMLSQRILYFAEKLSKRDDAEAQRQARRAIDAIESAHNRLTASPALSDQMRRLYFLPSGAVPPLDAMVRQFVADARLATAVDRAGIEARRALERMERVGPGDLLDGLNRAVKQYEIEARANTARIVEFELASIMLAGVTLVVEALLIFWPAQLAARRALDRLEDQARALENARDSEAEKSAELDVMRATAEHEALHDPLTGLANRRYLEREMERLAKASAGPGQGVAVLHVDLDRFKQINDTLGHAAGDFVLRHVASRLRQVVRGSDFVARVGGDEFVVLTPSTVDRRVLEKIAARVIEQLSKPVDYEGELCRFGASVGIDVGIAAETGPAIDPQKLLANADIALYKAKELGRGRAAFFCEDLRAEAEVAKTLADEILLGLSNREFFPMYQPQICAATGGLHGVEALARWRHPERGVLSPGVFLPIAERLGLSAEIDEIIFEAALADFSKWEQLGLEVPRLSVNVSCRRLRDARLGRHLSRLKIPRDRISFEILETVFSDAIDEEMRMNLDLIADLGVALEVDDFGTGHASLSSILALAPARLKIARELIQPLPASNAHRRLAQSILDIAEALDVDVVAEGVETAEQDALLTGLGCEVLQGFHFAKPMTAEALIMRLSRQQTWRPDAPQSLSA